MRVLKDSAWCFYGLHALCFAVYLYPLWSVEVLPFADYLNHLARAFILYQESSLPDIDVMYDVRWQVAPYMAMEAILSLLQSVTDIYTAGQIFHTLIFFLTVSGVVLLQRTLSNTPSYLTLLVYPYFYNMTLMWGFINFTFGVGVALISFAFWLRIRERLTLFRAIIFAVVLTVNYFCHAISYGILVLTIFLYEFSYFFFIEEKAWRRMGKRKLLLAMLVLPQILLWIVTPKTVISLGSNIGGVEHILGAIFAPAIFTTPWLEITLLMLTFMLIAFRVVTIDSRLSKVIAFMAILSLFVPFKFLGVGLLNLRMPVFIMFLVIAALRVNHEAVKQQKKRVILLASLLLLGIAAKYAFSLHDIRERGKDVDEFRQKISAMHLMPSTPLLMAMDVEKDVGALYNGLSHISSLAVIEAHLFVPELFTMMPPVSASEAFQAVDNISSRRMTVEELRHILKEDAPLRAEKLGKFAYIMVVDIHQTPLDMPDFMVLKQKGRMFSFYENRLFTLAGEKKHDRSPDATPAGKN